jgi:sortase A
MTTTTTTTGTTTGPVAELEPDPEAGRGVTTGEPVEVAGEDPISTENPFLALRRSAYRVFVIGLVVVSVVAVFEFVVTGIWYHARQGQLASDFQVGRARLRPGDAVGILQVPRLGLNVYIVEGDGVAQLRAGPGHRSSTPIPGRSGNSVVEGHANGWGSPFKDLGELHSGDYVVVQTRGKQPVAFKVNRVAHVSGDDDRLLRRSTDHRLTLVTADGGLLSSQRLVVSAVSGTAGHFRSTPAPPAAADESLFANRYVALALVALLLAWVVYAYVRRRYRLVAQICVVAPIAVACLLALLLELDLFLPKLR